MALRFDIGTLRPPVVLPGGRIRVDGRISRVGVFVYRNPDGTERREYRPPEEVFNEDSLASFSFAPVTDNHPTGPVTSENAKGAIVGSLGETISRDDSYVAASMVINDAPTIEKMQAGKVELSCGYNCKLEETPGIAPTGERYDAIQREIRGNHVALVDVGRAGSDVRVRMDGAVMIEKQRADSALPTNTETKIMEELQKKLTEMALELVSANARADAADAKLTVETKRADVAEADRDAAKLSAETSEKERSDAADSFDARVASRVALATSASQILGDEYKADASDRDVKLAVVAKLDGDTVPADKSDDYVDARYDSAVARNVDAAKAVDSVRVVVAGGDTRNDGDDPEAAAYARMMARNAAMHPTHDSHSK